LEIGQLWESKKEERKVGSPVARAVAEGEEMPRTITEEEEETLPKKEIRPSLKRKMSGSLLLAFSFVS
jgi:hypothetical protein